MHLISYADENFHNAQVALGLRALKLGFSNVTLYNKSDLGKEFVMRHSNTLEHHRGAGFWIWKPEILRMTVLTLSPKTFVLYLDSGILVKAEIDLFKSHFTDEKIHLWELSGQSIKNWTDPRVFKKLTWAKSHLEAPMIDAGAIIFSNSSRTKDFIDLWLQLCSDPDLLHPETKSVVVGSESYVWHRHDQSLLSLIVAEHPDWFSVHREGGEKEDWNTFFFRHRNPKIKSFLCVLSFERLRKFRSKVLRILPKTLSAELKILRDKKHKSYLASEEIESHRSNLYK